jgi:glucokinase
MADSEIVLGVDIGGTNTKFGLITREGKCLAQQNIPTNAHHPAEELFARLYDYTEKLFFSLNTKTDIKGIGLGAPNANYYRGTIENPPNLSWTFVDVVKELHRYYNVPVAVTNDANAAALGELFFGAARGMKDFIVITLGTGVGSGIVSNGALLYGANGFAGELGHTVVDPKGRPCGCGKQGCLETYASATGICRTVVEMLRDCTDASELRSGDPTQITAKNISEAAQHGDQLALDAFEFTGRILGMKLADAIAHTEPEAIILCGGLAAAGNLIFNPTKRYMEEYLFHIYRDKVLLLPSQLAANESAVLGASALIWNELRMNS